MLTTDISHYLYSIIYPISAFSNAVLFVLIWCKSSTAMTGYKKVLYLGCGFNFLYCIYMAIGGHSTRVVNGYYFITHIGVFLNLPLYTIYISYPVELFFIYGCVSNVAVQFLYRYFLICRLVYIDLQAVLTEFVKEIDI
uniref:Serpentine receptor class gamma n=1 Tax=Panagrellus redivivus TaxID=6233 RepID=A0A7E4V968_PANRE